MNLRSPNQRSKVAVFRQLRGRGSYLRTQAPSRELWSPPSADLWHAKGPPRPRLRSEHSAVHAHDPGEPREEPEVAQDAVNPELAAARRPDHLPDDLQRAPV